MSSRQIRETVKHCITTLGYENQNNNIQALLNLYDDENAKIPATISGWTFAKVEVSVKPGSEIFGIELVHKKMKVLFVVCEGDDCIYFVSTKASLTAFAADWGIADPVQANVELWTIS